MEILIIREKRGDMRGEHEKVNKRGKKGLTFRRGSGILTKLSGVRKFFADQLGVLLTNSKTEKEYEQMQGRLVKMELLKDAVDRKAYPSRLSAVPRQCSRSA